MKYDHIIKKNGVYYPAGSEVPELAPETETPIENEAETVEEVDTVKQGRPRKK